MLKINCGIYMKPTRNVPKKPNNSNHTDQYKIKPPYHLKRRETNNTIFVPFCIYHNRGRSPRL